jgi:hypothetical protein
MGNADWTVLPHRPIEKLAENLWRVEGDLGGMPLKRVMTIAKRPDGDLVVHNAIALDEAAMKEIDAWGPVSTIIVPNGFHRIDAPRFKTRYPSAKVYCPSNARSKVEKVLPVDGTYDEFPNDASIRIDHLEGLGATEGVMTVRSNDGATLVFNDAIFNMPHIGGFQGWVFKNVTKSSGGPRVTRIAKMFLVKDKPAFSAHLSRLAETDGLRRIIMSHHEAITSEPAAALRTAISTI